MAFLENLFGDKHTKAIKPFWPIVEKINALEAGIKALSDADLRAKTAEFKKKIRSNKNSAVERRYCNGCYWNAIVES